MQRAVSPLETPITQRGKFVRDSNLRHCSGSKSGPPTHTDTDTNTVMSHIRQAFPQTSTSSSRVSSVTRVEQNTSNGRVTGTLRLRAEDVPSVDQDASPARRIRWSEDVVDNEGMGKKSSKGTDPGQAIKDPISLVMSATNCSAIVSMLHLPQGETSW
jgi:hypothetical protein